MDSLVPFAPVSPSPFWTIRSWSYTMLPRRRGGSREGLEIMFQHVRENGEAVRVVLYVDRQTDLRDLLPLLDAARGTPAGMRFETFVLEPAPWDVIKPPVRRVITDGNEPA